MIILLYLCIPAFLLASEDKEIYYRNLCMQLMESWHKAQQEKRADEWKDIKKLENNVREAIDLADKNPYQLLESYIRWRLRCHIDCEFLTPQQLQEAQSTITMSGEFFSQEKDRIIAYIEKELKEVIEHDACGGVEWRDMYGETPQDMTPPSPKTLRASRLKVLENFKLKL